MAYSYTLKKTVKQSYLALWSKRFSLFACFVAGFGIYLSRKGTLPQSQAIAVMGIAFFISLIAIICAVAGFFNIWKTGADGLKLACIGFLISILLLAYPAYLAATAYTLPFLNDITSDFNNPPQFEDKIIYNQDFAILQRKAYPDIQPIILELNLQESQALVLKALKSMNLHIKQDTKLNFELNIANKSDELTIATRAYSPIMKLPETIVIRLKLERGKIQPETRIDMRSKSVFGHHDFGSNAQHLQKIIQNIADISKQN